MTPQRTLRKVLKRFVVALPLAVVAAGLPVVRPAQVPHVRTWAIPVDGRAPMKAPADFGLVGVSWPATSAAPREVKVRTSRDGASWTRWTSVDWEPDVGPDRGSEGNGMQSTEPVWAGRSRLVDVRFVGARPRGAKVDLVDPGPDPTAPIASAAASPSRPGIITRAQWGADESIRKGNPEYAEPLKLAIVHHTATADSYAQSESDDIVRGIYAYHVKTNGWDDIGYNFLVDRYGQIFEGRFGGIDKTVQGAHSLGFNRNSTGISVIGNFASSKPPEVAMSSLKRILAWRLDQGFVDPESSLTYISNGSNKFKKGTKVPLKAISAHRDVGKTACPGNPIYGSLGSLRTSAAKDGLPKLYDAKTSRSIITPNGDGVSDSLKLTGRISSQASWKVDVIDAAGTALKAVSGFGTTLSLNWYGKDAAGAAVPHGTYRFRVSAKNSVGTVRTSYIPFQVWRYPNGTFFQTKGSKITYILEKNVLRHPSHWQARSTRYLAGELVSVGDDITTAYAKGSQIGFRDGSVVSVEGTLYVISDGLRRQTTQSSLAALGYDPGATIETTPGAIAPNREGQPFSSSQGYPDGAALKSSTGQEAWVRTGIARRFFSTNVRTSWQLRDVDLAGPADSKVSEGLSQDPLGFRDGTLVRVADATTIYIISDGMRRAFSSAAAFARMGYKEENVRAVTPGELALHAEGKPI